ncbi:conserved hypothetical protein [Nakamurella panacisegetis]|uniref:Purine nucleoside phosphorylase n=1 Tax=Nakamurella panacisegetis TaxID=1090615 RepID=A0A1H0LS93_9ACTN|nr:peptidoglycan editing factor PgeF [Nakamurella panacisegetis]SDO71047.1 conserved hypothetical protein [Nakamurella panacisegetis]
MTWDVLDPTLVDAAVTTRDGGVSEGVYASLNLGFHVQDDPARVRANRERVAAALGVTLDDFVFGQQVHRPSVTVATHEHRGRGAREESTAIPDTDALVTATPGLVIAVMVADCVPLVLHDPVAHVLAVVHAGWRGTVLGVTSAAVASMVGLGTDPRNIRAGIGPAVSPDAYQVGPDVRQAAAARFGDRLDEVLRPDPGRPERWLFDLFRSNHQQLVDAGVPANRIELPGLTTGEGTPFFSDRAARPCGRFALVARLKAD